MAELTPLQQALLAERLRTRSLSPPPFFREPIAVVAMSRWTEDPLSSGNLLDRAKAMLAAHSAGAPFLASIVRKDQVRGFIIEDAAGGLASAMARAWDSLVAGEAAVTWIESPSDRSATRDAASSVGGWLACARLSEAIARQAPVIAAVARPPSEPRTEPPAISTLGELLTLLEQVAASPRAEPEPLGRLGEEIAVYSPTTSPGAEPVAARGEPVSPPARRPRFALEFVPFPDAAGPMESALVPWDTDVFGLPCHELRIKEARSDNLQGALCQWTRRLAERGGAFAHASLPPGDVQLARLLCRHGFYPVETLLTMKLTLGEMRPAVERPPAEMALRPATPAEGPELCAIAESAFTADRFHLDPNLKPELADERYRRWLSEGLDSGDAVLVYEDRGRGRIVGFLHFREAGESTLSMSLGAVAKQYQGTGVGAAMIQIGLEEYRRRGFLFAETRISTNNLPVMETLSMLGFRLRAAATTFHGFFGPDHVREQGTAGSSSH